MARIRTVKPEFLRHYDLYCCERDSGLPVRVAYLGLWTVADREGRFRWRPEVLKLDCLPHDPLDFSRVLDALATRGFIVPYASSGELYGWIPTFTRHQIVNNREKPSDLPEPDEESINAAKSIDLTRTSRVPHACPTRAPRQLSNAQAEQEQEQEQERELKTHPTLPSVGSGVGGLRCVITNRTCKKGTLECEALFEQFWDAYPRHEPCRKEALKSFCRADVDAGIVRDMVAWLERAKRSEQWRDKSKIPHATTWLNQRRWEGDPPPPPAIAANSKESGEEKIRRARELFEQTQRRKEQSDGSIPVVGNTG